MKNKSQIQEKAVGLFLRLNGYFQTSYISHSDEWGHVGTEIDRIAVRFPYHKQPEREKICSPDLQIPKDSIDVVIAEVKNTSVEFNKSLRSDNSVINWIQILNWLGLFEEKEVKSIAYKLKEIANLNGKKIDDEIQFHEQNTRYGRVSIRPIIFAFDKEYRSDEQKWWIDGITIMQFLWDCFCPAIERQDCSTKYPVGLWGKEYEALVSYFKKRHESNMDVGKTDDLYNALNNKY